MLGRLIAVAIVTLTLSAPAMAQEPSRLEQVLAAGTLRVGTTGDFNPMSFKDPATNEFRGFDIDVVTELAKDMEVALELVPTDWKTLINGIIADKYDMTTSASLSVARAKVAGFTDGYVEFNTVPVTLKANAARFDGWASIDQPEVTVATTLGTVFEQQARSFFPNARLVSVEAPARDFQEVLSGRALVAITSNTEASQLVSTYPELTIVQVEEPRNRRPGAFLVEQKDQVWINFLNDWIELKRMEGFFADLERKWGIATN